VVGLEVNKNTMGNNLQKFKRGNLVHVDKELGSMMTHFENDKDAIIVGSYADQFGGNNTKSYTLIFLDDGCEVSWYEEHQLTLIDEGGEHLFEEAKATREKIRKQDTDINYILEHLDLGRLSSESILMLFDVIGFKTLFHKSGEFFVLFDEWCFMHPLFLHIKYSKTLEEAKSCLTKKGIETLNIEKEYKLFHGLD